MRRPQARVSPPSQRGRGRSRAPVQASTPRAEARRLAASLVVILAAALCLTPACHGLAAEGDGRSPGAPSAGAPGDGRTIPVFARAAIFFSPDSAAHFASPGVEVEDRGRVVTRDIVIPRAEGRRRLTALLTIHPVPKDERNVFDRWDRAGNVRLQVPGRPDLELFRFVTAYGGRTEHQIDLSHLQSVLRGPVRLAAFIDTWVAPAWNIDLELRLAADSTVDNATWASPVLFAESLDLKSGDGTIQGRVEVPPGLRRVVLRYISTGHCTDGRDADEFISRPNVISVDGRVVHRFHPWRDDCRRYRERNPYTTRWTDGSWSSDYSRSGWCPGLEVQPLEIDLTDHLPAGPHVIRVEVEGIRPVDAAGNHGYWRVSASLLGWDHQPDLWRNW